MEKKMKREVKCFLETKVLPEEGEWMDKYGVTYSADKKKLITAENCTSKRYKVAEGTVAICDYAFWWNELSSIEIPKSVEFIGDSAFRCCKLLKEIDIPDGVIRMGEDVFKGCDALMAIHALDNKNYRSIDGVLYSADLKTLIKYPAGKEDVTFQLPDSVKKIEEDALVGCDCLVDIDVLNNKKYVSVDGVLYSADLKKLIKYPAGKESTSFQIPQGVTKIGNRAFENCRSLTSVHFPEGLRTIGAQAFKGCENIKKMCIPQSVSRIEKNALNFSLHEILIPKGTIEKFQKLLPTFKDELKVFVKK